MKTLFMASVVASTLVLAACGDDDTTSSVSSDPVVNSDPTQNQGDPVGTTTNSVIDLAVATPELSILVEAVTAAGLVDTLAGEGPFTIFAPTNDAFVALLGELGTTKDALLADTELLTSVLTYHVLAGTTVKAADVPLGQAIRPLGGSLFKVDTATNGLTITDGRNRTGNIIATDVMADNAVVHLIDRVILPADKTIVETAIGNPDFSILVEAVVAAGLADTLSGDGPFTVFAPTDAAFADLLAELGVSKEALLSDINLLTKVLTYHVVPAQVLKAEVPVGQAITSVQGETFIVDSNLAITDARGRMANIVATDIFNTNGVIHVIDRVILPATDPVVEPPVPSGNSIVDIALSNPDFSILVEAVVAANLVDVLAGDGPFTVFAPTNAAFVDLLGELHLTKEELLKDTQLLTDVLLYHVLGGAVLADDVPVGTHITTVQGGNIDINESFQINDNKHRLAQIIATDIVADNGVIHVIDRVLLPY
ncbi:MAG: fasciclin domain-containing protein [Burkholderiaceae bacterium]